jgi:hypothetical protein
VCRLERPGAVPHALLLCVLQVSELEAVFALRTAHACCSTNVRSKHSVRVEVCKENKTSGCFVLSKTYVQPGCAFKLCFLQVSELESVLQLLRCSMHFRCIHA